MLTWDDIEEARTRLAGVAHRTPVLRSRQFDEAAGATVFFKAENLQRGGAFKFRGAYNKIKAETERRKVDAVVAFSSGNHAQAVALVSRLLGIRATVVMPTDAPQSKIDATRGYGAEVVLYDRASQSRDDLAEQICREKRRRARAALRRRAHHGRSGDRGRRAARGGPGPRRPRRLRLGRRVDRRLGDGGAAHATPGSSSTAPSPRRPTTRSSRSPPGIGSRSPENPTIADGLRVSSPGQADVPDRAGERRGDPRSSRTTR